MTEKIMAFQIQTNMKKFKHKPSSWMVIDLDHIFRRHYIGLKKYYINKYEDNYFIDVNSISKHTI